MEKPNHITLTLPNDSPINEQINQCDTIPPHIDLNIRRSWNKLYRRQQNVIIMTVLGAFMVLCFLLTRNGIMKLIEADPWTEDVKAAIGAAIANPLNLGNVSIKDHLRIAGPPLDKAPKFNGPRNHRQRAVVQAFKHSWTGYQNFAWGSDLLRPVSETNYTWFGLGVTIVDALDTMLIMGLQDEFWEARDWVATDLKLDSPIDVNLFEVTIRILGGLLSAYHLSGDQMFLEKSAELGNRLLPCFLTEKGIPHPTINLRTLRPSKWVSSTSEIATLQLEFRDLSRSTGWLIYERTANIVNKRLHDLHKFHGLVPIGIEVKTGKFIRETVISIGAGGDSYYEYLLKQWLQTGRTNNKFITDYKNAIDGIISQLIRRTANENSLYIGELKNNKHLIQKMDHFVCFLPGTLLLGYKYGMPQSHMILATDLLNTCYRTYQIHATQLAADVTFFIEGLNKSKKDLYTKRNLTMNALRPEFIESLYYFYAITGYVEYQAIGWKIFQAFEKYSKVPAGYATIKDVTNEHNIQYIDIMESFWLSETLKYFYLLFSDNRIEIDLKKWVFNTEGHPLPIHEH